MELLAISIMVDSTFITVETLKSDRVIKETSTNRCKVDLSRTQLANKKEENKV